MHVRNCLKASIWDYPGGNLPDYELMWVKVETARHDILVGALYHPPKLIYQPSAVLDHLENCIDALTEEYPRASLVLAGDFNSLDNDDIISWCALNGTVDQPTCGVRILDRIYVIELNYTNVKVVKSAVKSDHKVVIVYASSQLCTLNKCRERRVFRKWSPMQHALFFQLVSQLQIELPADEDVQSNYDRIYTIMTDLLDLFYPEREITVTSADSHLVTPTVKAMLWRKPANACRAN